MAGVPAGTPTGHQPSRYQRRHKVLAFPATSGGVALASGRGRITGWSLLDTSDIGGAPAAANVLDGFLNAAGTLIAIPANSAWQGTISLDGEIVTAAGGVAAVNGAATITTAAGLTPSNQVLLGLDLQSPASTATGGGIAVTDEDFWQGWILNTTNGALNVVLASTLTKVDASAEGRIYPLIGGTSKVIVELYDGGSNNGDLIAVMTMDQADDDQEAFGDDGPPFTRGVFVNVVSGTVRGVVHVMLDD